MKPKTTEKRSAKKRSSSASDGLNLSPACLEAFSLFKAQIKEPDDSEAFIALIENSQIERLFDGLRFGENEPHLDGWLDLFYHQNPGPSRRTVVSALGG